MLKASRLIGTELSNTIVAVFLYRQESNKEALAD
jgi:hypothetical protein